MRSLASVVSPRKPQPPRIVLDTNVFLPALVALHADRQATTVAAKLLHAFRSGLCTLVVSDPLLEEYREVVLNTAIRRRAEMLATYNLADFEELRPSDALAGRVIKYRGVRVVVPADALRAIQAEHAVAKTRLTTPKKWKPF